MKVGIKVVAAFIAALSAGTASADDAINVKIGVLNDRSGTYADLSGEGSVIAATMAVEDFTSQNKSLKIDIVSADHQNKPDIASNIARQWFDQSGVDMIIDLPSSSAALAVSELGKQKDKLVIVSAGGLNRAGLAGDRLV